MTTHDRDKIIAAAKEVGAYRYINRAAKDEPTHTFTIEQLIAFYAIAFEDGRQAEREDIAGMASRMFGENGLFIADAIRARGDTK